MPFYEIEGMKENNSRTNPKVRAKSVVGEFMKVGIVTKPEGEGPPLHMHPNEEQFTLILDGKLHYILGEEDKIVEHGDLIHIPRYTNHRSRAVDGEATFSPSSSLPERGNSMRITTWRKRPRKQRRNIPEPRHNMRLHGYFR